MMPRYAARVDANQQEIVSALRGVGATVRSASALGDDFPDLVVGFNGANYLLEVKNPDGFDRVSDGQRVFIEMWAGLVVVVRSVGDALEAIGFREPGDAA